MTTYLYATDSIAKLRAQQARMPLGDDMVLNDATSWQQLLKVKTSKEWIGFLRFVLGGCMSDAK